MKFSADILKQFNLDDHQGKETVNNRQDGKNEHDSYVGAPYNYVPFSQRVQPYPGMPPKQNDVAGDLISGRITYELKAVTDIAVGGWNDGRTVHPYVNSYGNLAIPGSSVRGLVRANAQILSLSSFDRDIDDDFLMYRDMAKSGSLRGTYCKILGSKPVTIGNQTITANLNVRAGYLVHEKDGRFHLYKTKDGGLTNRMNYYIVSEKYINETIEKESKEFEYLYSDAFGIPLQYRKGTKFVGKGQGVHCKDSDFNGRQGGSYHPFVSCVRFNTNEDHRITGIYAPDGNKGRFRGCLVGTGPVPKKKALYVIPEIDYDHEETEVSEAELEKAIRSFQTDYNRKESTLRQGWREFFQLPKEGEEPRPVFYISYGGRFYFGYTPNLRLFYSHSVKEGLRQDKVKMDYCAALFGYVDAEQVRKGRVSFSDAVVTDRSVKETEKSYRYILGEPKPTSYRDYLMDGKTYNDDDFRLRGVKQYWIRDHYVEESVQSSNEKVRSCFKAIPAGAVLKGKVRFHNLTREELGLLLWSIELDPGTKQNIGKGKPYGFGTFSVKITGMEKENREMAYNLDSFSLSAFSGILKEKETYEKVYQDALVKWYVSGIKGKKKCGLKDIRPIRILMGMKHTCAGDSNADSRIRYMTLKEYQNRNNNNDKNLLLAEKVMKECPD